MPVPIPTSSLPITFRHPALGPSWPSTTRQTPLPLKDIQPNPTNISGPSSTCPPTQETKKTPHYHPTLSDAYNAACTSNAAPPPTADIHLPLSGPCSSGKGYGTQKPPTPALAPAEQHAPPDCPLPEDVQKRRRPADPRAIAAAQAQLALHLQKTREQQSTSAEAGTSSSPALYAIRAPPPRQAFLEALAQAGLGAELEEGSQRASLGSASSDNNNPSIPNMEIEATDIFTEQTPPTTSSRDSSHPGPSQKALGKRKRTGSGQGSNDGR
ncbi:hypothetical protein K523DRAFT_269389 [Schizophyllum commune Tattone D]|nr:hypothetical protein K523DRAFT_269389 [Schizophyllum commune Tattone D]